MTCHNCQSRCNRFGKHRNGLQRYRCSLCRKTFTEDHTRPLGEMRLPLDKAMAILQLMLEGMSIRAIERFTGVHRDTILSLMRTASEKARQVLNEKIQHITPKYVQMDEMWGFVHTREPNLNEGDPEEWGSTMVWLALDSETKLIISHHIGTRNGVNAHAFVSDLRRRTDGRYQVTSDQYNGYVGAMREHFGQNVDFGQLHKIYGRVSTDGWYGGGQVVGAVPHVKIGRPDFSRISTSHVERTNLSVRMHLRRFTRLTNAHSKTLANMQAAVTLYIAFYNFCRVNQALKKTPAMQSGIADRVWKLEELLGLGMPESSRINSYPNTNHKNYNCKPVHNTEIAKPCSPTRKWQQFALILNLAGTALLFYSFQATSSDFRLVTARTQSVVAGDQPVQYAICVNNYVLIQTDAKGHFILGHQGCPQWEHSKAAAVVNIEHPFFEGLGFLTLLAGFLLQYLSVPEPKTIAQLRSELKALKKRKSV